VPHELIKSGRSPISTASLSVGTIRNFIDNFGFTRPTEHAEVQVALASSSNLSGGNDMGGFRFIQGPGTPGFDPIAPLIPFGANLQNVPEVITGQPPSIRFPGGREIVRTAIGAAMGFFGDDNGGNGNAPIGGGLMRPTDPSLVQFAGGCGAGSFRNRTPWIIGPNGFPTCPRGYHPLKNGQPYCVRNRRMNPLNPRALSRAGRRVGGFARAVKRARTLKKVCRSL